MQLVISRRFFKGWLGFALGKAFVGGKEEASVRAAKSRDRDAFSKLMQVHSPALKAFIAHRVKESDRDDILQETWLAAWEGLPSFENYSKFRTWLFSICLHKVQDQWRRERSRPTSAAVEEAQDLAGYLPREFGDIELRQALARSWRACTQEQREMLRLYYSDGLTLKEIGAVLSRNLSTVKYQFYRIHELAAEHLPANIEELLGEGRR